MSDSDPLDLANLQLAPDWVKEDASKPDYRKFEDRDGPRKRGPGGKRGRPPKDGGGKPPAGKRDNRRGPGGKGGGRRDFKKGDRHPRGKGGYRRDGRDRDSAPRRLEGLHARILPHENGVEYLAHQIKMTGRAYSVFDLAGLVISARDRYHIRVEKDGSPASASLKLFHCRLDDSLWLNRDEALRHALGLKEELSRYYKVEQIETEAPRGNYNVVAVCGISGEILGPPNHHDYQSALHRLHQQRFSKMPFEAYKNRVKMDREEETIEKWKEQASVQTRYTDLHPAEGAEPVVLKSPTELDRHFSQNHADEAVVESDDATIPGDMPAQKLDPRIHAVIRSDIDRQKRHPMELVQTLCRQLEDQGLKFFKRDGKATFITRSRPRPINEGTTLSDNIRRIVDYIREHPGIDLNQLAEALSGPKVVKVSGKEAAPEENASAAANLSTEEIAILQDLRWLIREGFVIEYHPAGDLHLAPRHRRKRKRKKPAAKEAAAEAPTDSAQESPASPTEVPSAPESEKGSRSGPTGAVPSDAQGASPEPKAPTADVDSASTQESPAPSSEVPSGESEDRPPPSDSSDSELSDGDSSDAAAPEPSSSVPPST